MNTITIDPEVRSYLEEVRGCLDDLPDDELEEITLDLEAHLVEVHAEGGGPLADRLGSPAAYAAELRASAGFGRGRTARPSLADRLDARVRELAAQPSAVKARDAWAAFRPVWVAIRGWLLVALWVVATAQGGTVFQPFPVPHFGSLLVGLALVALATVASLAAADRAGGSRRWRRIDAAFSAVVVSLLLIAVAVGPDLRDGQTFFVEGPSEADIVASYPLAAVRNIFPYDLDGNPLGPVLLYDQAGNPLDAYPWTAGDQQEVTFLKDRFGDPIKNAFPVQQFEYRPVIDEETGAETGAGFEPVPPPRVPLPAVGPAPAAPSGAADTPPAEPPADPPASPRVAPR